MTRLGHTGLTLNGDWIGVDELVDSATGRLRRYQPDVRLQVDLDADLPPIWVHPALIERALFNVLENAAKFSPPGKVIEVSARVADGRLQLDVRDRGPGIPEQERSRIFDMFYSVERSDRGRQGTGLGLTMGLDIAAWWTPTAEGYFKHVSKAVILDAVGTFAPESVTRLAKLKKADIASEAERLADGTGWMPAIFKAAGPQQAEQESAQEEGSEQDAPENAEAMADEPTEALAA